MAELTKDELEREICVYDKQKLISYCLKLFETNQRLVETNRALYEAGEMNKRFAKDYKKEADRLKGRTLWQVLNERIEIRINRIKSRRAASVEAFRIKIKD